MDITSYLLGKNAGGGGEQPSLQNKSVTITENGTQNVTADAGYDGLSSVSVTTDVSGGGDLSEYFTTSISYGSASENSVVSMIKTIPSDTTVSGTSLYYAFYQCRNLTTIPLIDTSMVTTMGYMFNGCTNLATIPLIDTSSVTNMMSMFNGCTNLTTVPLLNTSRVTIMMSMFSGCTNLTTVPLLNTTKVTNMSGMFSGCRNLNDESLDNILQMCINATSYTAVKTLKQIGFSNGNQSSARIQALPHYQAFIDAGWTIGY